MPLHGFLKLHQLEVQIKLLGTYLAALKFCVLATIAPVHTARRVARARSLARILGIWLALSVLLARESGRSFAIART